PNDLDLDVVRDADLEDPVVLILFVLDVAAADDDRGVDLHADAVGELEAEAQVDRAEISGVLAIGALGLHGDTHAPDAPRHRTDRQPTGHRQDDLHLAA